MILYDNKYECQRKVQKWEVICTEQKYICVSRPRRFGKSMVVNMLAGERVQINTGTFSNDMTNFQGKVN